jgi:hypothetical protein
MKTANEYLRDTLGDLMIQNALLRAELDQAREALAQAERALERQQARPTEQER